MTAWEALEEYVRWRKALLATDLRRDLQDNRQMDQWNKGRRMELQAIQNHMRKLMKRRLAKAS